MSAQHSHAQLFEPIGRARAFEHIVSQVVSRIADGSLLQGHQLPSEQELAREFRVSRPTVRQALSVLSGMGLIQAKLGRDGGSVVTGDVSAWLSRSFNLLLQMNNVSTSHLMEARLAVELQAASLAAVNHTEEHLASMRHHLDCMVKAENDPTLYAYHGTRFHLAIAEASANPIFVHVMYALANRLDKFVVEASSIPELQHHTSVHEPIYRAIAERQPQAAYQAMFEHFTVLSQFFGHTCLLKSPAAE